MMGIRKPMLHFLWELWILAMLILFLFSSGQLLKKQYLDDSSEKSYEKIRAEAVTGSKEQEIEKLIVDQTADLINMSLPEINEPFLRAMNPEYAVWLYLPDSQIHYPVVYPKDNQIYLKIGFDRQPRTYGCLFLDVSSNPRTEQPLIIHGHNMKNGKMFGSLKKYLDPNYADSHSEIYLLKNGKWNCYQMEKIRIITEEQEESGSEEGENGKSLILSTCYGTDKKLRVYFRKLEK